ncbi:ABC transporter permease [Hymenobacter sp. H14-R3]|uniref:ABC transporter permease n=1 Tax=Hymenobacter sp. H14-R3 TaxID=3046308 RepID=UPI0024B91015|nr:ABC transporter permease [Hymenobacter sp. H14-R3]MDJ0363621.1 ABC transporter permease [Hymenobacter sp. H14-R3]
MKPSPLPPLAQPGYWLALAWLGLVAAVGLLAPWLPLPYPAAAPDLLHIATPPAWLGAGPAHYLGTDALGRDVLAGLVVGARRLLALSLPAVGLATLLGALAGATAGFWGNRLRVPLAAATGLLAAAWWGWSLPIYFIFILLIISTLLLIIIKWRRAAARQAALTVALPLDGLVMGATTLLGAVPRLILLVALAAGTPLAPAQLLGVLALLAWPEPARLVRAQMLRVRALPFLEAARASGLPEGRIWWHHALPHACRPLWAFTPLSLGGLIGLESALAFLGIGQAPDVVSWGSMLASVRQAPAAWWVAAGPGLALLLTLLSLQQIARFLAKKMA